LTPPFEVFEIEYLNTQIVFQFYGWAYLVSKKQDTKLLYSYIDVQRPTRNTKSQLPYYGGMLMFFLL
jgi:hypothetical protein